MSNNKKAASDKITHKKIAFSFLLILIIFAAFELYINFILPDRETASAMVVFTQIADSEDNSSVNTQITRSISALRGFVTDEQTIKYAAVQADITAEGLDKYIKVERFKNTNGAKIILMGDDNRTNAPIILGTLVNLALKSDDVPDFEVISYCDLSSALDYPYIAIAAGLCIIGVILCFALASKSKNDDYYKPRQADKSSDEYYEAVVERDIISQGLEFTVNIGTLPPSTPDGIENSKYIEAAQKLFSLYRNSADDKHTTAVIGISSAQRIGSSNIPFEAKLTAYLACAFAYLGKRTAVIECNLQNPSISKIFKKTGAGGISDIASGNCAMWDALAIDARKGVDIIAEKKPYPAPLAVFSSPAYQQIMDYLSSQYDVILLSAPKAWDDTWELISLNCSGILLAVESGNQIESASARIILNHKTNFTAICTIDNDSIETFIQ